MSSVPSVAEIVKNNNMVTFLRYRANIMYYRVRYNETDYSFPVYLEDIMDATLNYEEKAITLMRYIRKAMNDGTFVVLT
jgi:hypothetical protein